MPTITFKEFKAKTNLVMTIPLLLLTAAWVLDDATLSAFGILIGILIIMRNSVWEITENK